MRLAYTGPKHCPCCGHTYGWRILHHSSVLMKLFQQPLRHHLRQHLPQCKKQPNNLASSLSGHSQVTAIACQLYCPVNGYRSCLWLPRQTPRGTPLCTPLQLSSDMKLSRAQQDDRNPLKLWETPLLYIPTLLNGNRE